ncbi:MAG: DNA methyltransferase [Lysobacteraceae bacterium]
MPLSLNEIRARALAFSGEWAEVTSERAEAQSFWNEFFNVFGVNRRRVAVFEQKAARFTGSTHGRIDVFWPGVMLAEHKSEGRDLDAAYAQATDYFAGLKDAELPRFVLVSDFRRFRLHDLETGERSDFTLPELHRQIGRFGFISGYQTRSYQEEDPVNVQAAERMGRLHDALKDAGYHGHALELLLVRLLFCLFADDTGIFPRQSFHDLIVQRTSEDGADLGMWIGRIFQVLDTAPERRQTTLDEQLAELPWVNGKLFEEILPLADFNAQMRALLLDASTLDWSRISPAIFGSMFQSVMDDKARRNLGAHYTSEKNILKLIGPLFLDGLKAELDRAGNDEKKLAQLHRRLAALTFLDPACGCGNFLVIAYRELRALELEILRRQFATQRSVLAHVQDHVLVDVDQFHGIEIEEFPAQIAQVAMWLMDHQMNLRVSEQFGENVVRLPLKKSATIVHGNALRIDWNDVVSAEKLSFILGNPPFVGKKEQNAAQKADMAVVFAGVKGAGVLDFVSAWYLKAADYIRQTEALARHAREGGHPASSADNIRCAFVSTNSITQGEQVGVLWSELYRRGMHIQFAHRTFKWNNEARGVAAVHCVIVGFGRERVAEPLLFDYQSPSSDAQRVTAKRINPYLVDAPEVFLKSRSRPVSLSAPPINYGSMPIDDGHLILSEEERTVALAAEPEIAPWVRRYYGGDEFINSRVRWCLWLVDAPPALIRESAFLRARVEACRAFRAGSSRATTQGLAKTPALFGENRQPATRYLLMPKVSSENRAYIPCGFLEPDCITSGSALIVPGASLLDFGVLTSQMHMAWMRAVAGRMKSDYQYSSGIVYNNFPWPELPAATDQSDGTDIRLSGAARLRGNDGQGARGHDEQGQKHRAAIEAAAQAVLDARAQFPDATLADLYDPLTMPPALVKAHAALDKAVDAAYLAAEKAAGRKPPRLTTDAERVAFLFERYQQLTSLLPEPSAKPARARKPPRPRSA